jgi:hypothetical protein
VKNKLFYDGPALINCKQKPPPGGGLCSTFSSNTLKKEYCSKTDPRKHIRLEQIII